MPLFPQRTNFLYNFFDRSTGNYFPDFISRYSEINTLNKWLICVLFRILRYIKTIRVMTSSERRKTIKRAFFTEICERYPGTVIDHSEGGRYQISMPKYGDFELSGGDYWDICTYYIPWATPSKEQSAYHAWVKSKEAELQEILDNIVEIYK